MSASYPVSAPPAPIAEPSRPIPGPLSPPKSASAIIPSVKEPASQIARPKAKKRKTIAFDDVIEADLTWYQNTHIAQSADPAGTPGGPDAPVPVETSKPHVPQEESRGNPDAPRPTEGEPAEL